MNDEILDIPKVAIRPTDCLNEAYRLIGGQYWLFVGITAVGLIIGSIVPLNILMGPMLCGIYICLFQRFGGLKVEFETLFKGFDYFVPSLIVTLIFTGVSLVLILPTYLFIIIGAIGAGSAGGRIPVFGSIIALLLFFLFILALGLVVGTLFCFTFPLIVDRKMKAIPALKTSFRAASTNFGGLLGLVLIGIVISFVASLFCYLPVFLVSPIVLGSIAIAYRRVFPEEKKTEEPDMSESST